MSAQEEQAEQEREVEAQGEHESEVKAQEEGEVKAQGEREEDSNSLHEECHVSNRHMTYNSWWIRVDNGPHMRSASSQASGRTGPQRKLGRRDPRWSRRGRETERGKREERVTDRETDKTGQ